MAGHDETQEHYLHQNLDYLVHARKVDVKQLATAVGVTEQTIRRYMNCARFPGPGHLRKLSQFFQITVDEILFKDIRASAGESRLPPVPPREPRKHVAGVWLATEEEIIEGKLKLFRGSVMLEEYARGQLRGVYRCNVPKEFQKNWGRQFKFRVSGRLTQERFVILQFRPAKKAALNFALYLLKLDDHGDELKGRGVGYSVENGTIVTATLCLTRERVKQGKRDS